MIHQKMEKVKPFKEKRIKIQGQTHSSFNSAAGAASDFVTSNDSRTSDGAGKMIGRPRNINFMVPTSLS